MYTVQRVRLDVKSCHDQIIFNRVLASAIQKMEDLLMKYILFFNKLFTLDVTKHHFCFQEYRTSFCANYRKHPLKSPWALIYYK